MKLDVNVKELTFSEALIVLGVVAGVYVLVQILK